MFKHRNLTNENAINRNLLESYIIAENARKAFSDKTETVLQSRLWTNYNSRTSHTSAYH